MKKKKIQNIIILSIAITIIGVIIAYNYSIDTTKQKGLQFGNELSQIENELSDIQGQFYSKKTKWNEGDVSKEELIEFYMLTLVEFIMTFIQLKPTLEH